MDDQRPVARRLMGGCSEFSLVGANVRAGRLSDGVALRAAICDQKVL